MSFHRQIGDGLGFHRIGEILDALRTHLDRVRRLLLPEPGRMTTTLAEHRAIMDAIERRKAAEAGRAMRRHLDVVIERLKAYERGPSGVLRPLSRQHRLIRSGPLRPVMR